MATGQGIFGLPTGPGWHLGNMDPFNVMQSWADNVQDGYQFGDILKGLFGYRDDPYGLASSAEGYYNNPINAITGANSQMQWSSAEAAANRAWSTEERLATQNYNSAEAAKARLWHERMDSSAVQRRMADLQAAGVNPLYAFSGNGLNIGSSGGGSAASVSPGSGGAASGGANSAQAVTGIINSIGKILATVLKGK